MTPFNQQKYITWSKEVELVKLMEKVFRVELQTFLLDYSVFIESTVLMPDSTFGQYNTHKFKHSKCDSCVQPAKECLSSKLINFELKDKGENLELQKSNALLPFRKYKYSNCFQSL